MTTVHDDACNVVETLPDLKPRAVAELTAMLPEGWHLEVFDR